MHVTGADSSQVINIDEIANNMPEMMDVRRQRLIEQYNLGDEFVDNMIVSISSSFEISLGGSWVELSWVLILNKYLPKWDTHEPSLPAFV